MADWISQKEKEGHLKTKATFAKGGTDERPGRHPPVKRKMGPSQPSEDAAIYDMRANKSNKYGAVNRHLISKLKG